MKKKEIEPPCSSDEKNIEIEYIPPMGSAYSMKTVKQGRKLSPLQEKVIDDISSGIYKAKGFGRKELRRHTENGLKVLCGRIIRFHRSSEKEVKTARSLLVFLNREGKEEELEQRTLCAELTSLVVRIDKNLRNGFGRIYKDC